MYKDGGFQQTVKKSVQYTGIGLHTGDEVTIKCIPAQVNTGIVFKRVDLPGKPEIPAHPGRVISTRRCTGIGLGGKNDPAVYTVEHLLAATRAAGIDNMIIEIDNMETPAGDGSALPFYNFLTETGFHKQKEKRKVFVIEKSIFIRKGQMTIIALPYDGFKISYTLDFEHKVIGTQFLEFDEDKDSFKEEIAAARTFGFKREVEALHRRGLALGGSLDNAVLIDDDKTVNTLRYADEFVRHKILDVIGDMALNGFIKTHIVTVRSGHSLHIDLARKIRNIIENKEA